MDWFKGTFAGKPHDIFIGTSMVSGEDFPKETNPFYPHTIKKDKGKSYFINHK